jgi:two-component system osmolarity sensor histidine kinase EnvZ
MLKKLFPKTLFARAILIVVLPVVLAQFAIAVVFYDRHLERLVTRMANSVAGDITFMVRAIGEFTDAGERERILRLSNKTMNIKFTLLPEGSFDYGHRQSGSTPIEEVLLQSLDRGLPGGYVILPKPERKLYEITVPVTNGALLAVVPRNRFTTDTAHILVLWVIGISVLLLAIALLFMRNQVRPIRQLAAAADRFGKGQDVTDFRPHGAMEVRQAGSAFLRMSERINRQVRQRTEMLAGVSHDLRTPLTRMKLALAIMPASEEIDEMQADIDEMRRMIDGYLAFARGAQGEAAVETNVAELLSEIAHRNKANGEIEVTTAGDMITACQPQTLKRCVNNLVENACRFADTVKITANRETDAMLICVDDDGPGIAPEHRDDVFRPFMRLETSRNQGTGGVGLGLAIARDGMRSHGGDVSLQTSPLGGLRARVRIPL